MLAPYAVIRNAPYPLRRKDSGTTLNLSKDGGTVTPATATPVETPASSGIFYNILTVAEMTADHIYYLGAAGTSLSDGVLIPEPALDSGVAQAGAAGTITLRAGAPSVDLTGNQVEIVRGTGAGSRPRQITGYDTSSKVASVRPNFSVSPDNTSVYKVTPIEKVDTVQMDTVSYPPQAQAVFWNASVKSGTVNSGSTASVIKTNMTGYGTNQFVGAVFQCLGTNNFGIMRKITGYNTSNGDITVYPAFAAIPALNDSCQVFGCAG